MGLAGDREDVVEVLLLEGVEQIDLSSSRSPYLARCGPSKKLQIVRDLILWGHSRSGRTGRRTPVQLERTSAGMSQLRAALARNTKLAGGPAEAMNQ